MISNIIDNAACLHCTFVQTYTAAHRYIDFYEFICFFIAGITTNIIILVRLRILGL